MDSVMVWRNRKLCWLPLLALGLGLGGCADWPLRNKQTVVPNTMRNTAPPVPAPPEPAAALYIPSPPDAVAPDVVPPEGTIIQAVAESDPQSEALPALTPAAGKPPEASVESTRSDPNARLRELHRQAAQKIAGMNSYIMRLKRREVVQGRKHADEIILVKFRKEPFSVYLKWLGKEARDREVIYVKGRYDNLIHSKVAAGDIPLIPAGKRFSLPPDSFLARSNSRHPITTAGLGHLVDQFGQLIAAVDRGDSRLGTVKYLGTLKRPEFTAPVDGAMQMLRPGNEALMPGGGRRLWFFDTQSHLPVLLVSHDENQQEVEYYCHDRIQFPVNLDDEDFNPDKLWGKQR
jgi:hypothetical protein